MYNISEMRQLSWSMLTVFISRSVVDTLSLLLTDSKVHNFFWVQLSPHLWNLTDIAYIIFISYAVIPTNSKLYKYVHILIVPISHLSSLMSSVVLFMGLCRDVHLQIFVPRIETLADGYSAGTLPSVAWFWFFNRNQKSQCLYEIFDF